MKHYLRTHYLQLLMAIAVIAGVQFGLISHEAAAASTVLMFGTTTITQAFVQQWDTSIRLQTQQAVSRLQSAVTDRGEISGDGFTINYLGSVEMDDNIVRHGDTEWSEFTHANRLATMQDFYKALPLDRNDIPKMIVNPVTGGDYMRTLVNAKNRKIDQVIYNGMINSISSKDGVSTFTLPAGQLIAAGGTGLTKAKIIQARSIFRANEADDENGEELFICYNDLALQQILADTTLTSSDWMAGQMLQAGKVSQNWLGFTWIPYQRLNKSGAVYSTVAWAKSGVHFGKGYEEGNVSRRADKKDLWQVSMAASYGAGRQDEYKVVKIDFQ